MFPISFTHIPIAISNQKRNEHVLFGPLAAGSVAKTDQSGMVNTSSRGGIVADPSGALPYSSPCPFAANSTRAAICIPLRFIAHGPCYTGAFPAKTKQQARSFVTLPVSALNEQPSRL